MTGSPDNPFTKQGSQVDKARLDTLHQLKDYGGSIGSLTKLAEKRGVSKQSLSELLPKMESEGLINISSSGNRKVISLTSNGRDIIQSTPYPRGSPDDSLDSSFPVNKRLHAINVTVRPLNSGGVPEEWWSRLLEHEQVSVLKDEESDTILARDKWVYRCHKDSVTLQNREGVSIDEGEVGRGLLRLSSSLQEAVRWLSSVTGIEFQVKQMDIGHLEVAFEKDHQALLADAVPALDLESITVYDDEVGQNVVEFDKSKGVPERETLSGVRAEEVARNLQRENRQLALNSEALDMRHRWENELALKDVNPVAAVENIEKVEEIEEKQQQLLELKSEERRKTERLEELVKRNQEILEVLSEKVAGAETGGIVEPLARELEISSKWEDCHGNIMGYSPEIGRQLKVIDKKHL